MVMKPLRSGNSFYLILRGNTFYSHSPTSCTVIGLVNIESSFFGFLRGL